MKLLLFAAVMLSAAYNIRAGEICCPGLGCYNDRLLYILFPLPQCPEDMGIIMKLYTRQDRNDGEIITRDIIPSGFNGTLKTIFIVHGWTQTGKITWMHEMKDAFLLEGNFNVIIVGWKDGANHIYYPQSASNTRTVGGEIALVANNTISKGNSSKALMYCVGHSLGAHACGHAGQQGRFGRITGLDPAGPLFSDRDSKAGLNPSCASMVDVIHTDGLGLGMLKTLGHIDFYPNSGVSQPGCTSESLDRLYDWKNFKMFKSDTESSSLLMIAACSHMRAYEFFKESIFTPCFWSQQSCGSQYLLPASCNMSVNAVQSMGFNADKYPGRGIIYLKTESHAPFCLG